MCFERCLLIFTESNFGPKYVSNHVSWHVLGPTLAQKMFWTMTADMYWVQLGPYMCFEWWLLIFTGVHLWPWMFFERCLLTGPNFGPRYILNVVCWHVLGPKLALDVSWMVSAHIYWVQLWPYMCFERCFLTCTGCNFGPRCVLNDVCWYVLGPTWP
jgi:hypothetical protein